MQSTLSYFNSVRDQIPQRAVELREVVQMVRNCPQLRKQTNYIVSKHRAGILEQFSNIEKQPYQDDKADRLPAILPAGQITSREPGLPSLSFTPSQLLCLDIDENSPAELLQFYQKIKAGQIPWAVFAHFSPSGALNGSFALYIRTELPESFRSVPAKLRKRLGLDKREPFTVTLDKLNKAYYKAFAFILKRDAGIKAGKAGQSLKSVRYLAADPQAYYNEAAQVFKLQNLAAALEQIREAEQLEQHTAAALDINADTWTAFAEQFAEQHGYQLVKGQQHEYLTRISIAANLLGVPRDQVQSYAAAKGVKVRSNCISYPYNSYKRSFGRWAYRLEQNKRTNVVKGREGQKLADLLQPEQIFDKWLIAPTGSGKTYFVNTIPGRKVIVCPTRALVENVCKEYGAVPFMGQNQDLERIKKAQFIATTYASFRNLCRKDCISDKTNIRVFIDEAHNLTAATSAGYQLEDLTSVLRCAQPFKSITLLTGTYIYNHCPELRELEQIKVEIPRPAKQLFYIDAKDTIKAAANAIRQSLAADRFPLVLLDNTNEKGRLGTLQSLLSDVPGIKYFSSHTKQEPEFQMLVKTGQIRSDIRGIVTTSVLKEGNNIYNPGSYDIIILGNYHSAEIEQFSNRPRKAANIKITVIRSDRRETSTDQFNPVRFAEYRERDTAAACKKLNYQDAPKCGTDIYHAELKVRQAIKANPIWYNEETGQHEIDYLHLSHQVFRTQRTAENRNEAYQLRNLAKYGITHQATTSTAAEQTAEERQASKASREAAKAAELEQWNATLDQLAGKMDPLAYAEQQINRNSQILDKAEKAVLSRFISLRKVVANEAGIIDQLRNIGPKKAKFVLLRKQLIVAKMYQDADYLETNRKFAIVLKAIRASFAPGQLLTSQQIAEKLRSCLALDQSFNLDYLEQEQRHDRYFNIAKIFFELERKDQRNKAGQKVNCYQVCTLTFDSLFNKPTKVKEQINPRLKAAGTLQLV